MNQGDNPYASAGAGQSGQMNVSARLDTAARQSAQPPSRQPAGGDGLIGGTQTQGGGDLVKETTTANFTADVIQESRNQPVLVDFWAPWCGPCKQLTPLIEKAVREAGGKVKLVTMNIDDHPSIAGQMGIQSIPAVIAFSDGQPVDGFMGAVPESQIRQFIDGLGGKAKDSGQDQIEALLEQSRQALAENDINVAAQGFSSVLQADPQNTKALAGLASCFFEAGQPDKVEELLAELTDEQRADPDVASLIRRMEQAEEVKKLGDPAALEARLAQDPDDHAARRDLAKICNARGDREAAADHLLTIMRKDRAWEDDGGRRELLALFEAWGPSDPATLAARRRLSSVLFS
ncbi:thioredoxin [Pararhizobium mangrovi]|uniref:Thioredoxin n=1 Tax=Pararhizobium mangrovi TaxID=2590452 RepID=A0A506U2P2_9HYPH|nr:thioredoxin [Pararhizobium mangrovi]TPW27738.1 thioredoxin [Pararhizobium mangrovi]